MSAKRTHPSETRRTIEETAAYWAMRVNSPQCRPTDRAALEAWRREQPAHAEAYARTERALAFVDSQLGSPELSALGDQVLAETRRVPWQWFRVTAGAAAVLTLAVGLYFTVFNPHDAGSVRHMANTYETAIGERSTAILPDGSTVILNTDSRLVVDYTSDVRRLTLAKGQALFEVTKDPKRPFEVLASDRRIVAVGTAFDVRVDTGVGVQVTLLEGRVSVDEVFTETVAETAGRESNELSAGEQLIARVNTPTVVAAVAADDIERITSWRDGLLVFRDEPLANAIKEINRYSTTQLLLNDDPRLAGIKISGVFRAGRTTSFILALEAVHPISAQQVAADRITLLWEQ